VARWPAAGTELPLDEAIGLFLDEPDFLRAAIDGRIELATQEDDMLGLGPLTRNDLVDVLYEYPVRPGNRLTMSWGNSRTGVLVKFLGAASPPAEDAIGPATPESSTPDAAAAPPAARPLPIARQQPAYDERVKTEGPQTLKQDYAWGKGLGIPRSRVRKLRANNPDERLHRSGRRH